MHLTRDWLKGKVSGEDKVKGNQVKKEGVEKRLVVETDGKWREEEIEVGLEDGWWWMGVAVWE